MQKKCRRCGDKFTVRIHEDYCPECEKDMTPPGAGASKELTCEECGAAFIHKRKRHKAAGLNIVQSVFLNILRCLRRKKKEEVVKTEEEPGKNTEETHIEDSKKLTVYTPIIKRVDDHGVRIEHDAVNHPSHYTRGKIEVIDFIEDQQLPYHLGNVIKYIARAGHKGDKLEDLQKARWYLDRYINEVMGNETL